MDWQKQVAAREKPYDLNVVPDSEVFEYTDPRTEAATEARWRPVLNRFGIGCLHAEEGREDQNAALHEGLVVSGFSNEAK